MFYLARFPLFFEFFDTHFFKRFVFPKVEFFKFVQLFFERVAVGESVIDKRFHFSFFVADTALIYLLGISIRFLDNRVILHVVHSPIRSFSFRNVFCDFVRVGNCRKQRVRVFLDFLFPRLQIRRVVLKSALARFDTDVLFHKDRRDLGAKFFHCVFLAPESARQISVQSFFLSRAMPDFMQRRRIKLLHTLKVRTFGQMHFVATRLVIRLTAAVYDFRFVLIPIRKNRLGSLVSVVYIDLRFFLYRNAVHQRAVEHTVELPQPIHVFIHVFLLFARRHTVQYASIETLFRFFVAHFVVFDGCALAFRRAFALFVLFERPALFFHLLEGRPAVIFIILAHRNKRQKKVVDSAIFLSCNCRFRRTRRYPPLRPEQIAFFKVFHYLIHKLLSLRR